MRRALAVLAIALAAAGCSAISIPLGQAAGRAAAPARSDAEITTGSIAAAPGAVRAVGEAAAPIAALAPTLRLDPVPPEAPLLSERELETVSNTLASALLDNERPPSVPWLDQRSGHGGMILPVGSLARQNGATCRAVIVSVQRGRDTRWVQGNACRGALAGWGLSEIRPFRNPA
jgi:hypothetical protein